MSNCADAARLTPDQRFREAGAILAAGVLRLKHRAALPMEADPKILAKLPANGLEVSDESVLSVHMG